MIFENKRHEQRINELSIQIDKLNLLVTDLQTRLSSFRPYEERLNSVEIWQKQLHEMMIEKTPTGKQSLTKFAKKISAGLSIRK